MANYFIDSFWNTRMFTSVEHEWKVIFSARDKLFCLLQYSIFPLFLYLLGEKTARNTYITMREYSDTLTHKSLVQSLLMYCGNIFFYIVLHVVNMIWLKNYNLQYGFCIVVGRF